MEPEHFIHIGIPACDNEDRHLGGLPHFSADAEAITARKIYVKKDQIRLRIQDLFCHMLKIFRADTAISVFFKNCHKLPAKLPFIFHHKYLIHVIPPYSPAFPDKGQALSLSLPLGQKYYSALIQSSFLKIKSYKV